ncbi:MAG: hypothetical protein CME82_11585 [Halomonas sp.]|nr:hypothetical protein [Halomonas sp.]
MTEFEVIPTQESVNFLPASEIEEILQNVRTIIGTRKGSVPLDRDFGLDWAFVDKTINVAQALVSAEVTKQIRRYEPRARIISISLVEDLTGVLDGKMIPKVTIGVIE